MDKFIDYIIQYKYLCILLVVLCIVTAFVMIKAGQAVKRTNKNKEELIKKLEKMKAIRDKYSSVTAEEILNDESETLFEGLVYNIQTNLEKEDDMNTAYEKLNDCQKELYALNCFYEDGIEDADNFFKLYDKPLTPYALKGFSDAFPDNIYQSFKKIYDAFDEENESVSFVKSEIDDMKEIIKKYFDENDFIGEVMVFIKKNAESFGA